MKRVDVAAAVIERPDGAYLLGRRAPGTFFSGFWEFPGGKLEAGESARDAIIRELYEELGITVLRADPWLRRTHEYAHAAVNLHFFRVRHWAGELHDHVHDALSWQFPGEEKVTPMLPANGPVLASLRLPAHYAITQANAIGVDEQLHALERALQNGLRLLLLREPDLPAVKRHDFYQQALRQCHAAGARALIDADVALAQQLGADGVQLSFQQLQTYAARPALPLIAASCHDADELERVTTFGCDFLVLNQEGFAQLTSVPPAPTFAVGELTPADLDNARRHGAHGVSLSI